VSAFAFNPYFIDGFQSGDKYIYPWENSKAEHSETDDDFYFVHRGKLDIFNFSRKPDGKNQNVLNNVKEAYKFRNENIDLVTKGDFIPLKTKEEKVFAFIRMYNNDRYLVLGNLDFDSPKSDIKIKNKLFKKNTDYKILHSDSNTIKFTRKHCEFSLNAGEVQVIKF
jgi:hypothetical protein